ncbi:MAG: hypothetical protein ABI868_12925 [Acidobacteriota bacterium]
MRRPSHLPRAISVCAAATETVIVFRGRPSTNSIHPRAAPAGGLVRWVISRRSSSS